MTMLRNTIQQQQQQESTSSITQHMHLSRRSLDAANDIIMVDDEYFQEDSTGVIISSTISNILLFFLIFGLSATVNLRDLKHQLTNKFAILSGIMMQFFVMPLLGFTSILIFNRWGFSQAMGVSLLVVTASPGGSYSNWWCSLFNAELALSVAMTSVSSLLSIGLLPANLFLYGYLAYGLILVKDGEDRAVNIVSSLDYGAIFITLGVVMGAILGGLFVGYHFNSNQFHKRANYFGSICGITLILFSAFLGSGGASGTDTNFWSLPWSFYVGTAFPCIIGMALANLISRSFRLSYPEVVAISIECCYQNTAIGTSVAVTMFSDPTEQAEAVSVPLVYGMVEAILICLYCIWAWKAGWTKAPADEKVSCSCFASKMTFKFDYRPLINIGFACIPALCRDDQDV
jgi:predicted Na+-dependent transporter